MTKWIEEKLKDIANFSGSGADKLTKPEEIKVKLLNYMDVYDNYVINDSIDFQLVTAKNTELNKYNLISGDFLFTPTSETPDDIGHCAVINEDLENVIYSYHLIRFRLKDIDKYNTIFLSYVFNNTNSQKYFHSRATGITRFTLSKSDFENLNFKITTSKPEQTAIAHILTKVDDAIESVVNTIKSTEKLKKSLIQNLLSGKMKSDGTWRNDDEFKQSKIGLIPKEWDVIRAKTLCKKVTDGTHDTPTPTKIGFKLVTSKNLKNDSVDFEGCYNISKTDFDEINKRSKVEQFDILFGMIGTVGNPQIVFQKEINFAIKNVGLFKLDGNLELAFWIKNYLCSNEFNIYKFKQQSGTTQQFVSLGFLRKIPILVPLSNNKLDMPTIAKINVKINQINDFLSNKKNKLKRLCLLKKSLMQNLLTGKKRLSDDYVKQFEKE